MKLLGRKFMTFLRIVIVYSQSFKKLRISSVKKVLRLTHFSPQVSYIFGFLRHGLSLSGSAFLEKVECSQGTRDQGPLGRCKIFKVPGPGFGDFGPVKKVLAPLFSTRKNSQPPFFSPKKSSRPPFLPRKKLFAPLFYIEKNSLPPSSTYQEMKIIYIRENQFI